jgi:hypothetical protein
VLVYLAKHRAEWEPAEGKPTDEKPLVDGKVTAEVVK